MSAGNSIRLLLIEDDPEDELSLKKALDKSSSRQLSFLLTHAGRLDTGMDLLSKGGFDMILLDLNLPDSRGLDTLTALLGNNPMSVPVVVVAAASPENEAVALEVVRLGAQDYLVKGLASSQSIVRIVRYAIERQRLVQGLRHSETRTRTILENNADGVIISNRRGEMHYVNPAAEAIFGRPAEQLLGAEFGFPVVGGELSEIDILQPGGFIQHVEIRVAEIVDWDGQPAFLISMRDNTERKRMEHANEEIARMKATFIAGVTHDLRTPLASLMGFLKLMKSDKEMERTIHDEFLDLALEDAERLAALTEDVLEASRLRSTGNKIVLFDVDLRELITLSLQTLDGMARDKGITLNDDLANSSLTIKADRRALRRVLDNLIGNAIRYSNPGGAVYVRAARTKAGVLVEVVDQGIGISEEVLPKLFQKFYQGDTLIKRSGIGTGLGLYIAKEIVEAHGGTIGVKSKPGAGSVFHFTLPGVEDEVSEASK